MPEEIFYFIVISAGYSTITQLFKVDKYYWGCQTYLLKTYHRVNSLLFLYKHLSEFFEQTEVSSKTIYFHDNSNNRVLGDKSHMLPYFSTRNKLGINFGIQIGLEISSIC